MRGLADMVGEAFTVIALVGLTALCACAEHPHGSTLHDGGLTVPPAGWVAYCDRELKRAQAARPSGGAVAQKSDPSCS